MIPNKTIAAISSGLAPAAIGVVRMSGSDALNVIQKCLKNANLTPRKMHSRIMYSLNGEKLDEVLVCYFKGPHSFTGEDSIEIYAHGGSVNLSRIIHALCEAGAIPAEPGEFSKRAFLNGKMDLSQAEAIMDVIHAQNDQQCREAQRQLSGSVSESVSSLRSSIMSLLCAIEASIDFSSEEELAPLPVERIQTEGQMVLDKIMRMKRAHEQYRAGGLRTVFAGKPNAGKSSLFNCLLGHERAIVTNIAGTTTDTIESQLQIGSKLFCLIDTAGMTETNNPIESIGITRTKSQIQTADILVVLFDGSSEDCSILDELRATEAFELDTFARTGRIIVVKTKSDLKEKQEIPAPLNAFLREYGLHLYEVSVITRDGMAEFEEKLLRIAEDVDNQFENVTLITSQRHITHLNEASSAVTRALSSLEAGFPAECIASDLHEAADALALITGSIASEDVINEIFSHFCIGK